MSTKCRPPPSLCKLLLLTAYALVAYSTISAGSSDQPDWHSHVRTESARDEEKTLSSLISELKNWAKETATLVNPNKQPYIDDLLHSLEFSSQANPYSSPEFFEIAKNFRNIHFKEGGASQALFDGLVRKKQAHRSTVGASDFFDLTVQILYFMGRPADPIAPLTVAYRDPDLPREIVMGLKDPLLAFWKSVDWPLESAFYALNMDVHQKKLFLDPKMLLWIDYAVELYRGTLENPHELVIRCLRKTSLTDWDITEKLIETGKISEKGALANNLWKALMRKWGTDPIGPDEPLMTSV